MATVTCRTEECPSAGVPVELNVTVTDEEAGETRRVDAVMCGACGQEITDIQEES